MADIALKDLNDLATTERATALMAAVSDDTNSGVGRKFTMAQLAQILQAVNGLETERVTLFDGDPTNGTNNLDIRTGVMRHSFADRYFLIEIYARRNSYPNNSHLQKLMGAQTFRDSSSTNRIQVIFQDSSIGGTTIHFVSNTSFNIPGTLDDMQVYGYRNSLTTP